MEARASSRQRRQRLHGFVNSSTPEILLKGRLGKETEHLNVAVEEVEKWVNKRVQKQSQSKRLAVTKALEKLEDIAGGKSGGHSWKENLNDTSSYDDVQREAAYHFAVKEDETTTKPLHEVLDTIFLELEAARTDLDNIQKDMADIVAAQVSGSGLPPDAVLPLPVSFTHRISQAWKKARITHTESFLFQFITSTNFSGRSGMIQARIDSISDNQMEADLLQPALWWRATMLSNMLADRRRLGDAGAPLVLKKPRV